MSRKKKIPILHTFEICDKAEIKNGKKSLFGLFNSINSSKFPATHSFFSVVLGFSKGIGKFICRMVIIDPSNKIIREDSFNFLMNSLKENWYHLFNIVNLEIFNPGEHHIIIYVNDNKIGDRILYANLENSMQLTEVDQTIIITRALNQTVTLSENFHNSHTCSN